MTEPVRARKSSYRADLVAERKHAWCACRRSDKQPFRDGSRSGSGTFPVLLRTEDSKTVRLCG